MVDSGCCGGGACGPDRREFLGGAVAASAFASLGGLGRRQGDHFVPADKQLGAEWLAALTSRAPPQPWTGAQLRTVAMPCGGIGSGQLYVDGTGRLAQWWIANDACHSSYGGQTTIATPTGEQGVCYGTFAPPRPVAQGALIACKGSDGQTQVAELQATSFLGEYPVATLAMGGDTGELPVQVTAEVYSPFVPLVARDSALPATVLRYTLQNRSGSPQAVTLACYLESPLLLALRGEVAAELRAAAVRLPGCVAVLMDAVAPAIAPAPLRMFADFETGYGDWQAEGEAFGSEPASGTLPGQQAVTGFHGKRLVNTFRGGDATTGRLTSPEFTIDANYLCCRIGGGRDAARLGLQLLVDGVVVRQVVGRDQEHLRLQVIDVKALRGARARLRIVDEATGPWGHINVDDIGFSDAAPAETEFTQQHPQAGEVALCALADGAAVAVQLESVAALRQQLQRGGLAGAAAAKVPLGQSLLSAVASSVQLAAGETAVLTFGVTWFFPNRRQDPGEGLAPGQQCGTDGPRVGNRYAAWFTSALAVARELVERGETLRQQTFAFRDALYRDTTLPHWFVQRLGAPLSTLATATLQWWAEGRVWAWEGVGCCSGTCGHVWNYAQGMARLFPELERSVRKNQDFAEGVGLKSDGAIGFRGLPNNIWAGDAQAGYVLKAYREHLCSGDDRFLREQWPAVQRALDFLIRQDGSEPDGLLEGRQHNTYDIDFYGGNTMVGSLYLAALRAAAKMALHLGDREYAARCTALAAAGAEVTMHRLWNGEYFVQQVDLAQHGKHQYADGCLSDQLLGQWFADQLDLGPLYAPAAVRSALQSIWKYNWAPDCGPQMQAHKPDRWFAHAGEPGLFVCTWPKGQHLGHDSVLYRDEVWTGIEYQVAAHLLREGLVTEGLSVVHGIHRRYDGSKHNPFNEVECGDHYARALASWSCLLAISGFQYDGPAASFGFAPKLSPEDFRCLFTASDGWGSYSQTQDRDGQRHVLAVHGGGVAVKALAFELPEGRRVERVACSSRPATGRREVAGVAFVQSGRRVDITLPAALVLHPDGERDCEVAIGFLRQ